MIPRRILPGHFTRRGVPKIKYESREKAQTAGRKFRQQAYKCDFCGKWHLGGKA